MNKLLITGAMLAFTAVSVHAQGSEPEAIANAKQICTAAESNQVTITKDAFFACKTGEWPRITNAGLFYNTGVGAEFNTLARNIHVFAQ